MWKGGVFNLGVGQDIRVGDLADMIVRKVGQLVEIVVAPERLRPDKSEVLRLISDNRLAREKLGWQPEGTLRSRPGYDHHLDLQQHRALSTGCVPVLSLRQEIKHPGHEGTRRKEKEILCGSLCPFCSESSFSCNGR